jgi:hypothetical protein
MESPISPPDFKEEVTMALSIDDLFDRALELSTEVDENFLDLGKYLRQLHERDPEMFHKVVKKSDIKPRKAYYLVEISKAFDGLPIPKSRLRKLGWTKLALMTKQINKGNAEELVELAEGMTTKQLEKHLKGEEHPQNSHCVLMYFSPQQYEEFEKALLSHGGSRSGRGILNKEQALINALTAKATKH